MRWGIVGVLVGCVAVLAGCALFNSPPVASFTWSPLEPLARKLVQFTDLSTDNDAVVGWIWDFGDSQSSVSKSPTHEYAKSGTYTVRLTVTDTKGTTAMTQRTVNVGVSVDGTWRGTITDSDAWRTVYTLVLVLNHSTTGGITGTMTIDGIQQTINSATFNPDTGEANLTCNVFGLTLRGTMNASENMMSGWWYDQIWGDRGEDWNATLQ